MSGGFVSFQNEPGTSSQFYSDDENTERLEMNAHQYPNYNSGDQSVQHDTAMGINQGSYGMVGDEEDDMTDDCIEKEQRKNVGYRKFILNNSEQFKSILGGNTKYI